MIYVVVGPTGVGKTSFSIKLAKSIGNAEIINCDSMQIYKELQIGVAKIKEEEKEGIKHHLFDVKSILEDYNCFDYQKDGRKILDKLLKEGKNVIIVGGTGLYIKALLYDYTFNDKKDKNLPLYSFKMIGLTKDRHLLYEGIDKRVGEMINEGLLREAKFFYDKNIKTRSLLTAIGYKELYNYFEGKISLDDAISLIKKNSRHYAKRQYTFFNNQFSDIVWYDVSLDNMNNILKKVLES